ncbi:Lanthionine synthetase C family protein [Streptomyces xiamenensis]|uniref:Lanthionine synthetase C family protein n=1 Tax=Streptomyces xiamenensis TaxID=408015 RepID=A0A0F7FP87_9ACTN|nr:MmpS family transport accessory protein [Streptomyces xiamenensis]AKG41567.1 Lanthionine synthetase C family protein [Streptomyces xiamenensis]
MRRAVLTAMVLITAVGGGMLWWQIRQDGHRRAAEEAREVAERHDALTAPRSVEYRITGDATTADVTWTDSAGQISQAAGRTVPMIGTSAITTTAGIGDQLYVSAQNQGHGTITCTIAVDGTVVTTTTSSGAYAIVTCQGTAP